ncbi:MAG TPA: hypothetical protein VFT22_45535, partial [Kofleriaceae bacterium]|nr:hypothetical protein [Kofleriaceae bacterium]
MATAYDLDVISARCVCLLLVVGCATPMSALREDNRRLAQTVSELRSDRRAQDRKLRDLQHQLDEARASAAATAAVPALPVEVAAPEAPPAQPAPGATRVVGVADDGTEIVYEGDAAAGHPAAVAAAPAGPSGDEPAPPRRPSRAATA